jgi:ribosomal protein S18 acetylase RimI-like enzyme
MDQVEVSALARGDIAEIKPLLEASRQKPYRFLLPASSQQALDTFWLNDIAHTIEHGGRAFAAWEAGQICGALIYSDLPWDTAIIQRRMGALKYVVVAPNALRHRDRFEHLLDCAVEWAASSGIEFLLCKAYTDDAPTIHTLQSRDFLLMDTLLDYVYDFRRYPLQSIPHPTTCDAVTIREADTSDVDELVDVAQASFRDHFGRFHFDERIGHALAGKIYEEWIKSSVSGYADWILVAEVSGKIAGYSAWKRPSVQELSHGIRMGHLSIIAVHPDYRRRGLFSTLTRTAMKLFEDIADYIEGPTHLNNYAMQRACARLAWQLRDTRHSFHRWLTRE